MIALIESSSMKENTDSSTQYETQDYDEVVTIIMTLLKKREYWRATYCLSIQFPELKTVGVFLSILFDKAVVAVSDA